MRGGGSAKRNRLRYNSLCRARHRASTAAAPRQHRGSGSGPLSPFHKWSTPGLPMTTTVDVPPHSPGSAALIDFPDRPRSRKSWRAGPRPEPQPITSGQPLPGGAGVPRGPNAPSPFPTAAAPKEESWRRRTLLTRGPRWPLHQRSGSHPLSGPESHRRRYIPRYIGPGYR